jgi:predicted NUDIX family phosphoesterase
MNTENNRLIAEFLGLKTISEQDFLDYNYDTNEISSMHILESKKYDTDWNQLIEVIVICREKQVFGSQRLIDNIDKRLLKLDLIATYRNVVDFIQFHNEQK